MNRYETKLYLNTESNPKNLKGLENMNVEAIVDRLDRVIALVPIEHSEFVMNALLKYKED